jgi:predicted nucleotidyltransferase
MEQDSKLANKKNESTTSQQEISALENKINVDKDAIEEARESFGDENDKVKQYLINNRGL